MEKGPIELIALDSFQPYRFFKVMSEIDVNDPYTDRKHLYDCIDPFDTFTAEKYVEAVKTHLSEINKRNVLPILLGYSISFLKALLKAELLLEIIGMPATYTNDEIPMKAEELMDEFLQNGLMDEIQEGLDKGYRETKFLTDPLYLPFVEVLDGKRPLKDARNQFVEAVPKWVTWQMEYYNSLDIQWLKDSFDMGLSQLDQIIQNRVDQL